MIAKVTTSPTFVGSVVVEPESSESILGVSFTPYCVIVTLLESVGVLQVKSSQAVTVHFHLWPKDVSPLTKVSLFG